MSSNPMTDKTNPVIVAMARALEPQLWMRWDDRANRHAMSEKILAPLITDSMNKARAAFAAMPQSPPANPVIVERVALAARLRAIDNEAEAWLAIEEAADALEAMPSLVELREALEEAERALKAAHDAHKKARGMVPDEEEGLAAQVFCRVINHVDSQIIHAISKTRAALAKVRDVENPNPGEKPQSERE